MSRHLEIVRRARLEGDLFARPATWTANVEPPSGAGRTGARDQWQQLVHQLFLGSRPAQLTAIGLASATPGEGASYVASHLATELARSSGRPCLLLEANLYRPAQADRFGMEPDPGLRQALAEPDRIPKHVARPSAIEHLWVMPAGSPTGTAAEAPDWTRFPRMVHLLREQFAGIVVDLPPVNLSTDAFILGRELDGLVLVVRADLCSREVIRNALDRLQRANPNLLGAVLNRRRFVIPEAIYRRL